MNATAIFFQRIAGALYLSERPIELQTKRASSAVSLGFAGVMVVNAATASISA